MNLPQNESTSKNTSSGDAVKNPFSKIIKKSVNQLYMMNASVFVNNIASNAKVKVKSEVKLQNKVECIELQVTNAKFANTDNIY